ncbi:MAG: APC family permease [Kiritimatiellae bacterium]|nr:APC family permease [Kiritimatiellia bacterium]
MQWLKNLVIGKARNISDRKLFQHISLIALLAWVGLGADGLSSSCYGPEEAFKALGAHSVLALFVGLATVVTITIICASYAHIIELFPGGGGGYLVASKLLSPSLGVVSGCALLVDYVLTIALSIASGTDALFSVLPVAWQPWKLSSALAVTSLLALINLRGVKESVLLFAPVFFIFLATHAYAIIFGVATHLRDLPAVAASTANDLHAAHAQLGWFGLFLLLVRSYSVGAGTYTGIEAVSNGLPVLREPRVATGKRTMLYMGVSLALTVGGLMLAYVLFHVQPQAGQTLNATLLQNITADWPSGLGGTFVTVAMLAAMTLLFIASQAGFIDGPRVLANMALDRWFPSRFANLSDRFVAQNGVLLMAGAALVVLVVSHGSVALMVVLYSINVFITFSLSQLGMVRHWWTNRAATPGWKRKITINSVGFCLTSFILVTLSATKFLEGGWVTLAVTGLFVGAAFFIHRHYRYTVRKLARLDDLAREFASETARLPYSPGAALPAHDPAFKTAVVLVNGFNGLGVHTLLHITRMFPNVFRNFVFMQVGVVDAGNFKGAGEIENLRQHIMRDTDQYAEHMRRRGFHAEVVTDIGTDIIEKAGEMAAHISQRFPQAVFFGGQLVFPKESWLTRLLHNFMVFALQRQIFRQGIPFLIVPIRV